MVSVGVSKLCYTDVHVIEPAVKLNGAYYHDNLLAQKLLPDMCWLSQDEFFLCFNRTAPQHIDHTRPSVSWSERRPASFLQHCGRRIHRILTRSTTAFAFCSVLQQNVYSSRVADADELKTHLMDEWAQFNQSIIHAAIDQWHHHLSTCVCVHRGTVRAIILKMLHQFVMTTNNSAE